MDTLGFGFLKKKIPSSIFFYKGECTSKWELFPSFRSTLSPCHCSCFNSPPSTPSPHSHICGTQIRVSNNPCTHTQPHQNPHHISKAQISDCVSRFLSFQLSWNSRFEQEKIALLPIVPLHPQAQMAISPLKLYEVSLSHTQHMHIFLFIDFFSVKIRSSFL